MDEHYEHHNDGPPSFEDMIRLATIRGFFWGAASSITADLIWWAVTHAHITWN